MNGKYLDVKWEISVLLYYTTIFTSFSIPHDICTQLNLKYEHSFLYKKIKGCEKRDDMYEYSFQNEKYDLDDIKSGIYKVIDEIIKVSYDVGGTQFLESQRNIEKLLEK